MSTEYVSSETLSADDVLVAVGPASPREESHTSEGTSLDDVLTEPASWSPTRGSPDSSDATFTDRNAPESASDYSMLVTMDDDESYRLERLSPSLERIPEKDESNSVAMEVSVAPPISGAREGPLAFPVPTAGHTARVCVRLRSAFLKAMESGVLALGGVNFLCSADVEELMEGMRSNTTRFQTVNMKDNKWIGAGARGCRLLAGYLADDTKIRQLTLQGCGISMYGCYHLSGALTTNVTLVELTLRENSVGDRGAELIGEALASNHVLERLDISYNKISDDGALRFAKGFKDNSTLRVLQFSSNGIGPHGVEALVEAMSVRDEDPGSGLDELLLRGNKLSKFGAIALADFLSSVPCPSLKTLHIGWNDTGCGIGDLGASHIATALRTNTVLQTLGLEDNQIGYQGMSQIASALQVNEALTSLAMGGNTISPEAIESLEEALQFNFTLRSVELDISATPHLVLMILGNPLLTALDFGAQPISASDAPYIARALSNPASVLSDLDLSANQLGVQAIKCVAGALHTNAMLTRLNLHRNQLEDEGAQALFRAMEQNSTLTYLNVSDNKIHTPGARFLVAALQSPQCALTAINFAKNFLKNEGAQVILDHLSCVETTQLHTLNAEQNQISVELLGRLSQATQRTLKQDRAGSREQFRNTSMKVADSYKYRTKTSPDRGLTQTVHNVKLSFSPRHEFPSEDVALQVLAILASNTNYEQFVAQSIGTTSILAAAASFGAVECVDHIWTECYADHTLLYQESLHLNQRLGVKYTRGLLVTVRDAIATAIRRGHLPVLKFLFEKCTRFDIQHNLNLDNLCRVAYQYGGQAMVTFLQSQGASPFVVLPDVSRKSVQGCTHYHKWAEHPFNFGGERLVGKPLEVIRNELLDRTDAYNRTPLDIASAHGQLQNVEQIFGLLGRDKITESFCDSVPAITPSPPVADYWNPLHEAAYSGSCSVVRFMLDQELFQLEQETKGGRTPLELALAGRKVAMRQLKRDQIIRDPAEHTSPSDRMSPSASLALFNLSSRTLDQHIKATLSKEEMMAKFNDTINVLLEAGAQTRPGVWIKRYILFSVFLLGNLVAIPVLSMFAIIGSAFSEYNLIEALTGRMPWMHRLLSLLIVVALAAISVLIPQLPEMRVNETLFFGTVVTFYCLIMTVLLLLYKSAQQDEKFCTVNIRPPAKLKIKRPLKSNTHNALALATILLEYAQLSSFSFAVGVYPNDSFLVTSSSFLLVRFNFQIYNIIFWLGMVPAVLWILLASYLQAVVLIQRQPSRSPLRQMFAWVELDLSSLPFRGFILPLLADTFFLTIVRVLLDVISCTFVDGRAVLWTRSSIMSNGQTEIECFVGTHGRIATCALFVFIYYVFSTGVIGIFFFETENEDKEIRWIEVYILFKRMLMVTLTVAMIIFPTHVLVRLLIMLFVDLLFVLRCAFLPRSQHIWSMIVLRTCLYVMATWSVVCSLIAYVTSWMQGAMVMLIGGSVLIPVCVAIWFFYCSKACTQKNTNEESMVV